MEFFLAGCTRGLREVYCFAAGVILESGCVFVFCCGERQKHVACGC